MQSNNLRSNGRGFRRFRPTASRARARLAAVLLPVALSLLAGCSRAASGPVVTIHAAGGDATVRVELALDRDTQARGLMYRTELDQDAGMLFVFPEEQERSFWMSNTPLPLDILFMRSDGTIRTIAARTTPYSEKQIPSRGPIRYVLEVNAGWCERHGVKAGDKATLPAVAAAQPASQD